MNYRKLEILGVVLGSLALGYGHFLLFKNLEFSFHSLIVLIVSVSGGLLLADFLSGTVHWFADTFGHESWPLIGQSLIRPFREHHVDPASITKHDFVETNGSSFLLVAIASAALASLDLPFLAKWGLAEDSLLGLAAPALLFLSITNEIHKMAHLGEKAPAWFRKIASRGWLLSAIKHRHHHCGNFDKHFCITTGWLNGVLDRVRFFKSLEIFIRLVSQRSGRPKYDSKQKGKRRSWRRIEL
jgi:hypothetical protein